MDQRSPPACKISRWTTFKRNRSTNITPLHASHLNSSQLVPRFALYGKCGTFQKCTENAVLTTNPILLQYRWYRDWYRTTAFSVDPYMSLVQCAHLVKIRIAFTMKLQCVLFWPSTNYDMMCGMYLHCRATHSRLKSLKNLSIKAI